MSRRTRTVGVGVDVDVDLRRITVDQWEIRMVVCRCGREMQYDPCGQWYHCCSPCGNKVSRSLLLERTRDIRQELFDA